MSLMPSSLIPTTVTLIRVLISSLMEVTDFSDTPTPPSPPHTHTKEKHDIYKAKTELQGLYLDGDFPGEKGDSGLVVLNLVCYWNYQENFRKP